MKKIIAALTALLCVGASGVKAQLITVSSFDDIKFWAGSGTNQSALIVEFNNGDTPFSVAWGYRWDSEITLETMMFALAGSITNGPSGIAGADPRLSISVSDYGSITQSDYFLDTLTYDQAGLSGGWPAVPLSITGYDGKNWNNLFTLEGTSNWSSGPFVISDIGMSSITLVDGGWYGWVLADGPETYNFSQPVAAIPEPSTWALLVLSALGFGIWRIRRATRRV